MIICMKKLLVPLVICLVCVVAYAEMAPTATAPFGGSKADTTITLNFVGDILAARSVETRMRQKGYDYPFEGIRAELSGADVTFANLETPLIGTRETGKTTPGGSTTFRGDIDFAAALKRSGIDVVSLANNHMKDQGGAGIQSTLDALDKAEVAHAGAGMNLEEARKMKIIEVKKLVKDPIKVGYLAYNDSDVVPASYYATANQSGTHIMNIAELKADIALARPQVDILVISMHSGTEYVTAKPNSRQTEFAHAAIDSGADLIIGHHPHVLEPMEIYKGKYIFYSLGNFVFDQPWPDTKESVLLRINATLEKGDKGWNISSLTPNILPLGMQYFAPYVQTNTALAAKVMGKFSPNQNILTLNGKPIFVELATTSDEQMLGLSNRKNLSKNTGLLFVFDTPDTVGIWMKDMLFPIDIYWFDKDLKLVDKRLSVSPATYPDVFYPKSDASYVLETEVGLLDTVSLTKDLTGELTLLQSYDKR
jgi:poly-gamma-glutamate capsule biosynthesis protein CapA/YwtB (metallophosphatase superfamily)/uncharacterized membrane protein (UPF0127 family)